MRGLSQQCLGIRARPSLIRAAPQHNKTYRLRTCALGSLSSCQVQDVLELKLLDGTTEVLEVVQGWDAAEGSAVVMRQGQLLRLAAAAGEQSGSLQLAALGE